VAFVALRRKRLYDAQVDNHRESPAHRGDLILDVLKELRIGAIVVKNRPFVSFHRRTPALEVIRQVGSTEWQDVFPVLGDDGKLVGVISAEVLRTLANSPDLTSFALADDMMGAPVAAQADADLHVALETLLRHGLRELVVIEGDGSIVGILDESEITRAYHDATRVSPR
jgi:CIC family chloride channel protein